MRCELQNYRLWHKHFCLWPTKVEGHLVWQETVWRRHSPFDPGGLCRVWEYQFEVIGKWDKSTIDPFYLEEEQI